MAHVGIWTKESCPASLGDASLSVCSSPAGTGCARLPLGESVPFPPPGGWDGQATFKLAFRKGGAIKFSQLLMNAASAGEQNDEVLTHFGVLSPVELQ